MTIQDIYQAWTAEVQKPGTVSLSEATDIAQTFGPTLSDEDGDAWWNAIAVEYNRLNIITQPTYVQLRNHANNNEQAANELFEALKVEYLPATVPVNQALAGENLAEQLAAIPNNIATIEGFKTGGTSVSDTQLDDALDQAIFALQGLEVQLTT